MCTSRKRYRPLEIGEEREIGLLDVFSVDTLDDEKSYCFSWPDAPLSVTMSPMYVGSDSKSHLVSSGISFPKLLTSKLFEGKNLSEIHLLNSDFEKMIVLNVQQNTTSLVCIDSSPKDSLPPEESIFSLTAEQLTDARSIGLLSPEISKSEGGERLLRLKIEAEVIQLEWRAFKEAKHTASALQRLLSLENAVPFLPPHKLWRKLVYILWIFWRTRGQNLASRHNQRWGSPLLPGAFLYGVHSDYFLNFATARGEIGSHGKTETRSAAFTSRRRTPYNFLSWKVERVVVLQPKRERLDYTKQLTSYTSILSSSDVKNKLSQVLREPFGSVELDETRSCIDYLECADLKGEVRIWKKWLCKV